MTFRSLIACPIQTILSVAGWRAHELVRRLTRGAITNASVQSNILTGCG